MVQVRFIAQPFADGRDLRDFVHSVADDASLTHLDVVVAWAKRSGLSRISGALEAIKARSIATRIIVGIDEGGATRQGLELARTLFDTVHVFHDRSGRTFHSKLYLAWGQGSARLLVGSHNATAGGVYFNYETGLESELTLPDDADLLTSIHDYVTRLYAESNLCKELSDAVFAELIANPRYRIGDEDFRRQPAHPGAPEDLDAEVDLDAIPGPPGAPESMFGGSVEPKRGDPVPVGAAKKAPAKKVAGVGKAVAKKASASPQVPVATVERRWFKRMSPTDAMQNNGHKINALRLSQAKLDINWLTYFRHEFFDNQVWSPEASRGGFTLEVAQVEFHVVINGNDLGAQILRVDHAQHREQGQANVPTDLKWGPTLSPLLRGTNFTDYFVVLERLSNGGFRLTIDPHDPGPDAFLR